MRAYERFLKYATYHTTSDDTTGTTPSTKGQLVLAKALCAELKALGLADAEVSAHGYVYATLPKNTDRECNTVGFVAHMDTSSEASGENVRCQIVDYKGGDVTLNEEKGIYLRVKDYPYLQDFAGQHIITSDGTTLIGADDKAGIAEIMTALERLISEDIPHGKICVAFTPDEEIGEGVDHFELDRFPADYAYTVDGGALGELEYENFNAASAKFNVHGVSIHPGSAKDKMINAARIIAEIDSLLPEGEIPEKTSGYEGFHHLLAIEGSCEIAKSAYIIRDHDKALFEKKKSEFLRVARELNEKYGEGTVELELSDSYYNMRSIIEEKMFIVERAEAAMRSLGIEPIVVPIRGGTDGAGLSYMGMPTPNLCTGGMNFHSRFEFVSVEAMDKIADLLVKIAADLPLCEKL